jgi:LysM repeat protein
MSIRHISLPIDDALYRRLSARAAYLNQSLADVTRQHFVAWLGNWGLHVTRHTIQKGETLSALATRYYQDASKAPVIAAFNDITLASPLQIGQVLLIPETGTLAPLPRGESPYLYGLHDRGGEYLMSWAGRKSWVLITEALGCNPSDMSGRSYADLADAGYGIIVRLNNGYGQVGTLPRSDYYADFARRCGNFIECSAGCHIWIIGNEPNLSVERPGGPQHGELITPERYAQAFTLCRQEIRSRPGHEADQVVMAAVGPWNVETAYPANPSGDWIVYFQDVIRLLGARLDGIALHTYGRDASPAGIVSEARMDPPFHRRRKMFRTYIDFMEAIPATARHLAVYITETDQNLAWLDEPNNWIQEAYAEIDRWNANPDNQPIRSLVLYRWTKVPGDIWNIRERPQVIADFRAALQRDYRWYG